MTLSLEGWRTKAKETPTQYFDVSGKYFNGSIL